MGDAERELRLDKWLWAARFFKTRSMACAAINGGKVHVNGDRVKPSRRIRPGDRLEITRGTEQFSVVVAGLKSQRRPAGEARLLYTETGESIGRREKAREMRRLAMAGVPSSGGRPDKRDRRRIRRFTGKG